MTVFAYKAKQGPVKTVEGRLVADSRSAAAAKLEAMGCIPVWVEESDELPADQAPEPRRIRVAPGDVTVFTRQLGGLLRAGVPILRALSTIQEQTENTVFRTVIGDIVGGVRDGKMFSESLVRYPRLFPELYVNMVRSGESAGVLDEVLMRLAEARETDDELRGKVLSALAYPAFVLAVGFASVFIILTFFLPKIMGLFQGMGRVLPLPTRIVMAVSGFFADYWGWMVALGGLAVIAFGRFLRTKRGRLVVDGWVLRLPLLGKFARDTDIVRFARTLALLVRAGIPVERALTLGGHTLMNRRLRTGVLTVAEETVRQGATVASGLRKCPEMPAFVTSMVAVGEESGRLDEVLLEVASFYQRELDRGLKLITTLLEPVLILLVGIAVGFIIFAMLLPIFQIGQGLR